MAYANFEVGTVGDAGDVALGLDNPAPGAGSVPARDWHSARYWAALRAATPLATDDGLNFLRLERTVPMGIRYWEVGNENYGNWEFDLQSPPQGAVTYATRARVYIDKIRAVDRNARVGVVVVTGNQYNNWTATVLGTLNTLNTRPDFVIYHRYEQAPGGESDAALLQKAASWPSDAADLRTQLNTAFGAAAANIPIFVTENNSVYSDPGKQSLSLVNGLYLADSIANVMKTEIESFAWWDLRNGPPPAANQNNSASLYGWRGYGDYGILSTQSAGGASGSYETYPTYHAFKLLRFFARNGDEMVQAASSDNLLAVYAARRHNATNILVINKDPANARVGNFTLTNVTPDTENYLYSYGKPNDDAARPGGTGCRDRDARADHHQRQYLLGDVSGVFDVGDLDRDLAARDAGCLAGDRRSAAAISVTAGGSATFSSGATGCPVRPIDGNALRPDHHIRGSQRR